MEEKLELKQEKDLSTQENTFETLNKININDKIKTKMGLKYLSWAYAWETLQSNFPGSIWTVYTRTITTKETLVEHLDENTTKTIETSCEQEIPYFTDGKSGFVKVGVTIEDKEYIEYYPIMGLRNEAIMARAITMTDVNKSIQRAFVKCAARHGLGLYVYAGEDLPEGERNAPIVVSNATDFKTVQQDVTNLITKLFDTKFSGEVTRYVTEMTNGVRISQLTEDKTDVLIKIREYLKGLMEQL